ncbi:TetR/AcrR family transcriptional regulator [Pyruvatibacter mobilis]|uniref:TetR/AcrR family transcriptional regulator n=1 Tax=Pyruvatibacter mobilis TaxID=1712261 RepID=UPI003C7D01FF
MSEMSPDISKQAAKSAAMRRKLLDATISSLVDQGYARTTTVEICRRAGVTRGALLHHFRNLSDILAAAMSDAYDRFFLPDEDAAMSDNLAGWIDAAWEKISRPEFKAVIEVWLAARNDPKLGDGLWPAIAAYKKVFTISENSALRDRIGSSAEAEAFYRMAAETMIGMALGRATTPGGKALDHEDMVIDQLRKLADEVPVA